MCISATHLHSEEVRHANKLFRSSRVAHCAVCKTHQHCFVLFETFFGVLGFGDVIGGSLCTKKAVNDAQYSFISEVLFRLHHYPFKDSH